VAPSHELKRKRQRLFNIHKVKLDTVERRMLSVPAMLKWGG